MNSVTYMLTILQTSLKLWCMQLQRMCSCMQLSLQPINVCIGSLQHAAINNAIYPRRVSTAQLQNTSWDSDSAATHTVSRH